MLKYARRLTYIIVCLAIAITIASVYILKKETKKITKIERRLSRKHQFYNQTLEVLKSNLSVAFSAMNRNLTILPERLSEVPCSQEKGIVKNVKSLDVKGIVAPYNASIIEGKKQDYYIFFRYDVPVDIWNPIPFYSYIGFAKLNKNFDVLEVAEKLNTKSKFSEDPRIVKVNDSYYLSYNDKLDTPVYCRSIHVAQWHPEEQKLSHITNLDQHIQPIEKNWVPFEYGSQKNARLHFVYSMFPHKIMRLDNPSTNSMVHLTFDRNPGLQNLAWTEKWGKIRGGTPARLIENEYLSFFHSSFTEDNIVWYVMGAYTFENKPPFRITSISRYPILFKGIYESPHINTAPAKVRCIFPAGFAIEHSQDQVFLHVSCGENDAAVKIVTIDYDRLKKSMVRLKL
jgi:predicted GH43/DUF377 family glycosyl hydrolase